jgi:ribosome maturation factor RimP
LHEQIKSAPATGAPSGQSGFGLLSLLTTTFQLVRNGRAAPLFFEKERLSNVYDKEKSLYREVAPRVERSVPGVEVLAVELSGPERFTVFIDHPQGVDHALCERVTDVLRDYLDRFSVDVSSPGTDRPLREPRHFERVVGRKVALRTADEIAGRTRFRGEVVAADDRGLKVATGADEPVDIPYETIVRGNLIGERK